MGEFFADGQHDKQRLSYRDRLRDPRWQRRRLESLESADWMCQDCGARNKQLDVHHYWYEPLKDPWDYPDDCFSVLCTDCHDKWHREKLLLDKSLSGFASTQMLQVQGLVCGLRCATEFEDYCFCGQKDALFVAAFVRGFWPPIEAMNLIIDECFRRLAREDTVWFSTVLTSVVDFGKHGYIQRWVEQVNGGLR